MTMMERTWQAADYRYVFQGQETDDEIFGEGKAVNYTFRMHDARIGQFLSIDPLAAKYPWNSPYAFSENRGIDGVELEGLKEVTVHSAFWTEKLLEMDLESMSSEEIMLEVQCISDKCFRNASDEQHARENYEKE